MKNYVQTLCMTLAVAGLGGVLLNFLHMPLSWVLGPIVFLLLYKGLFHKKTEKSATLQNIAFLLLGIQIGSTFTTDTVNIVTPYFFPFLLFTLLTIFVAILSGYFLSKLTKIDKMTSVLGAIPGGLSAMVAMSESFKSNTIYVTLFHSIRLLAVLFIVPFVATHFFMDHHRNSSTFLFVEDNGHLWTIWIYVLFYIIARLLDNKVPASYVIIPMLFTAISNSLGLTLFHLPMVLFIAAQIILGANLGHSVSVEDLKNAGKHCTTYFLLNIVVIAFTFFIGYLFTLLTPMNLVTAILSFAPGGLVEMAITAQEVGGDPSIVGSLQMIRLLIIVLLLPLILQWILPKFQKGHEGKTFIEKSI
ncbi:AbrB family transcriptional regulator [Salirhabdus sp. Marseille-P4669]|uniref:AbrB family transcriptional regulator n=1 Tax=Salirhabdus sp. Marseille-P4669 TaxID=2042310 RepID=UPI001356AA7E|nr:AbrB family transcriptional regulator [Salirhabdus sp. Marseille-P4669]